MGNRNDNNRKVERDLLRKKILESTWVRGVIAAAGVVVFCTVYALILPAAATTSGNDADNYATMGEVDGFKPDNAESGAEDGLNEGDSKEETSVIPTDETADPPADGKDPAGDSEGDGSGDGMDGITAGASTHEADQNSTGQELTSADSQNTDVSGNNAETPADGIKSAIPDGEEGIVVGEIIHHTEMDDEARDGFDNAEKTIGESLLAASSISDNSVVPEVSEQAEISAETSDSVSDNTTAEVNGVSDNTEAAATEMQTEVTADVETSETEIVEEPADVEDTETDPETQAEVVEEIPVVYAHDLTGDANGVYFSLHAEDSALLPETTRMIVEEVPVDQYDLTSLGDLVYGRVFTVRFTAEIVGEDGSLIVSDVLPADNVQVTVSSDASALGELDTKVALDLDRNGAYVLQESADGDFVFTAGQVGTVGLFVVAGEPEVEEIPVFAHELTAEVSGMTVKVEASDAAMIPEKAELVVEDVTADVNADVLSAITNVKASHFLRFSIQNEIVAEDGTVTTESILPASNVTVTVTVPDEIKNGYKKIALNPVDGSEYVLAESETNAFTFETAALDTVGLIVKSEYAEKLTASVSDASIVIVAGEDAGISETAVLSAEEVPVGSPEYSAYRNDAASHGEALFARFFKLSLTNADGTPVVLTAPVSVELSVNLSSDYSNSAKAALDMDSQSRKFTLAETAGNVFAFDTQALGTVGTVYYSNYKDGVLNYKGSDYEIKVTYKAKAEIPETATLSVRELTGKEYDDYVAMIEEMLGEEATVNTSRMFDITIMNDGVEVEPKVPVDVDIKFAEVKTKEGDEVKVVHFEEDNTQSAAGNTTETNTAGSAASAEGKSTTPVEISDVQRNENTAGNVEGVSFSANGFSIYAVYFPKPVTVDFLSADGKTYKITIAFDEKEEIPNKANLEVNEILEGTDEYQEYVEKSATAIGEETNKPDVKFARVFDISIRDEEREYEPKYPVDVKIEYAEAKEHEEGDEVSIVHFAEKETEVLESEPIKAEEDGDGVTFQTNSFSIYAVVVIDKEAGTFEVEDENYKVSICYTKEANIPIGTKLTVKEIEQNSAEYVDLWEKTVKEINNSAGFEVRSELESGSRKGLTDAIFFDISLIYGEQEIEPAVPLQVRIEYKNGLIRPENEDAGVVHFGKTNAELINDVTIKEEGAVYSFEYEQNSFSPVGTYTTGDYVDPDFTLLSKPGALSSAIKATGDGEVGAMVASKTLDPNDDGTYTLKLKVTGQAQSGTSSSVSKSNVVIVVDVSYSMNESAGRYLYSRNAETAYNETGGRDYYSGRYYKTGTAYYASSSGNTRVYPTYDGQNYRWATWNNYSGWNNYTGPVYLNGTRLEAEKAALCTLVDALLSQNKPGETITDSEGNVISLADIIEITLVKFSAEASTVVTKQTDADAVKDAINSLSLESDTNWEDALRLAKEEADAYSNQTGETTSIIFVTDGEPTNSINHNLYFQQDDWYPYTITTRIGPAWGYTSAVGYMFAENYQYCWGEAKEEARAIVEPGKYTLYNIFAYGSGAAASNYLKSLTNYAYTGNGTYSSYGTTAYTTDYFFDASDTTKLQQAFEKIINSISNHVAFGGVDVHDGVSFGATNSTLLLNDGTIDPTSFTYTVSTGTAVDYTVRVNNEGQPVFTFGTGDDAQSYTGASTTVQVPDPADPNNQKVSRTVYSVTVGDGDDAVTYVMSPASLYSKTEDGVTRQGIEWDLTGIGTLAGGQSYELSFIVWPNQKAYDLIAELNNGHITLEQAAAMDEYKDIVPYITGNKETGYSLSTNWEQYVDYYRVEATTDESGDTTYTYTEQEPVILNPGKASLAVTKMYMNKVWNDSLDETQIAKILEENPQYQVFLRIWKADTEDALAAKVETNGNNYDQRIVLGWQEGTPEGEFLWTKDYTVSPGVMVKEGDTAAVNLGLTRDSHEGYKIAKYRDDYYFILEEGHYYTVTEENIDPHFILEEHVYHPMVVNGVVSDVEFNGIIAGDPYGAIGVTAVDPMTSVNATNTLRGGINITKVVKNPEGEKLSYDGTFEMKVTMDVPKDKNGQPDFSNVEDYTNQDGSMHTSSVAWYRYYDKDNNVVAGDSLAFAGETNHAYGTWFYLDFDNTTGRAEGTIIVHPDYTVRFTNMATGTTYDLVETQTNGMNPSYSFTHVDDKGTVTTDGNTHTVEGNKENNIQVTNTTPVTKVELTKIGDWLTTNPLNGVQFKMYSDADGTKQITKDNTGAAIGTDGVITTGADGKATIGSLVPGTYYLVEVKTPDGYNTLTGPVIFTVKPDGTLDYSTGNQNFDSTTHAIYAIEGGYGIYINNLSGVSLPHTGSTGTKPYTLSGLALIIASALLYSFRMRHNSIQ